VVIKRGQRPLETEDSWSVDATPGRVLYGAGAVDLAGEVARDLGGRRVLVVADPGVAAAGHVHRASLALRDAGLDIAVFYGVGENPGERHVAAAAAAARAHDADFLIGLGGGSAMDCAKGANFIYTNGGRMENYWGFGKASRPMLPSIGVPCTAGTGSEAQSFAVISREDDHRKMACGDPKARFAATLLDPELVRTAPPEVMAATGLDALSHALESFVTTAANPYSRMFASEGFARLLRGFDAVVEAQRENGPSAGGARSEAEVTELWGEMLLGAHFSGAAIEASMLGAAHGLANPLTARYDITHGVAVAVMLDHVVRFNGEAPDVRYGDLARLAFGGAAANGLASERLAELWVDLRRGAGVAGRLRDLGVREEDLDLLSAQATEQWTSQFNPRSAAASDMLALYRAAF
jgi:alcohol dehydrogenase